MKSRLLWMLIGVGIWAQFPQEAQVNEWLVDFRGAVIVKLYCADTKLEPVLWHPCEGVERLDRPMMGVTSDGAKFRFVAEVRK